MNQMADFRMSWKGPNCILTTYEPRAAQQLLGHADQTAKHPPARLNCNQIMVITAIATFPYSKSVLKPKKNEYRKTFHFNVESEADR